MSRIETGHCFCGAIQAEMTGDPFWVCYDHDDDCRRAIGGPLMVWIGYRPDQFRFKRGSPRSFSKTKGVVRTFCGNCGTSIGYLDQGLPDELYICIGFMDEPTHFPPVAHAYWTEKLPFVHMEDGLAHTDGYTRSRDPLLGNPKDR